MQATICGYTVLQRSEELQSTLYQLRFQFSKVYRVSTQIISNGDLVTTFKRKRMLFWRGEEKFW